MKEARDVHGDFSSAGVQGLHFFTGGRDCRTGKVWPCILGSVDELLDALDFLAAITADQKVIYFTVTLNVAELVSWPE